jgi:hypothetical protein
MFCILLEMLFTIEERSQMARYIDFIKDINAEKKLWKLVRVEDIWKSDVGNEHLTSRVSHS